MKRTLESLDAAAIEGRRALVRVDFNCPIKDGVVTDNTRIRSALPTIRYLRDRGARVILLSHLGRPKGGPEAKYSLKPVVRELEKLLGAPVTFLPDPTAEEAVTTSRRLPRGAWRSPRISGSIPVRRRTIRAGCAVRRTGRFLRRRCLRLRTPGAREHGSGRAHPQAGGLRAAHGAGAALPGSGAARPRRPFLAILGGAKISGKIDLIEALLPKVDGILIGGAMACTFFRAMGLETGNSLVEADRVELARSLMATAGEAGAPRGGSSPGAQARRSHQNGQPGRDPGGVGGLRCRSRDRQEFAERIGQAGTALWNGPMGVFETPPFDRGTMAVARAMAAATGRGAITIVGGGDSASAVAQAGLSDRITHVSTGGGASLEFLEGKELPGVAALDEA